MKIYTRANYEELKISNIKENAEHYIQLKYDRAWRVLDHQLPVQFDKTLTNLQDSVRSYLMLLENLRPFYSSLEMLDEVCIVGEPEVTTPRTTWRLVKFSNKVFIKIEFLNPLCIDEVSITFHGCTSTVKEMSEIYSSKCDDYNDETIYNKLLCIFDIPYFPADIEDFIDCSICLSYRCENNRCPVVCCDNEKCDSTFHISCLEKYLKVQKHVKVLSICIGECPFCKQTLSNSYAPFFQKIIDQERNNEALAS